MFYELIYKHFFCLHSNLDLEEVPTMFTNEKSTTLQEIDNRVNDMPTITDHSNLLESFEKEFVVNLASFFIIIVEFIFFSFLVYLLVFVIS